MHVARNGIKRAAGRAARPLEQIFVYERGQLVFAESNNEVYNLHESRGQMTLRTLGYGKGHQKQTWEITPYGLALQAPCVLVRSSDARYNSLSDDALFPYRARTETDFLRSRADLAENGLLNGMDSAFPSLGYLGGCVERLDFHGHPAISMGLQTDVFADQAGGQVAYNWDKGLTPWIDTPATPLPILGGESDQNAEAVTFVDSQSASPDVRGTWLIAHFQQNVTLLTVLLHTADTSPDAWLRLKAVFDASTPYLAAHLRALAVRTEQ